MKSIPATLQTNQKTAAGLPIARASLLDNNHLHPVVFNTGTGTNIIDATANLAGDTIVRIRRSGADLQRQIITSPSTVSQWTSGWVTIQTGGVSAALAIFQTGTYIVAVWRDTAAGDLRYRRSSDNGSTWSASALAYATIGSNAEVCGVSHANQAGVMIIHADISWGAYDSIFDTWSALNGAGLSFNVAASIFSIAAAFDNTLNQWAIAFVAQKSADVPAEQDSIRTLRRTAGGSWGQERLYLVEGNAGASILALSMSQQPIDGHFYLCFRRQQAALAYKHFAAAATNPQLWQDAIHLHDAPGDGRMKIISTKFAGYIYLATEDHVMRATASAVWTNKRVLRYKLDLAETISRLLLDIHDPLKPARHLRIVVDNADGSLTDPDLFQLIKLERGYNIAGTDYYVSAGTYFVTAWRWLAVPDESLLELDAVDSIGLLYLSQGEHPLTLLSHTLQTILEILCAHAGAHLFTFDASTIWASTLTTFTFSQSQKALDAIESLRDNSSFEVTVKEDGTLAWYVPAAGPAAGYTFGAAAGQHNYAAAQFGKQITRDWHLLEVATYANSHEASDPIQQALDGFRLTDYLNQPFTISQSAHVVARRRVSEEQQKQGLITAPPAFDLEIGDVIAFGQGWGATNGPWRVTGFDEYYNPTARALKFQQQIFLRGTA